jgi:hypothetical protein
MHDFAYLFPDSAASWLNGRGDARFHRYERFYRESRAAAASAAEFDLEASNERYATMCRPARSRIAEMLDSKLFKQIALSLTLLWISSSLLPTVGHSEPVATGAVLVGAFVFLRVKRWRGRARHP